MKNFLQVSLYSLLAGLILFIVIKLLSRVFDAGAKKINTLDKKTQRIIKAVFMLIIIIWPILLNNNQYVLRTSILVLLYIVLALSLNIVMGYAGQLSMGHAAFYGIGAYTTALLMVNLKLPFFIAIIIAGIISGIFGMILAMPTLRLKGDYLAIVTVGFGEIIRLVLINWTSLTRGPAGITGVPSPSIFGFSINTNIRYFYLILVLVMITIKVSNNLLNSRLGRGLIAIKDDEVASEAMGINSTQLKIIAFVLSAILAGIAGGFFATFIRYVNPDNFSYTESVSILCMVVLGGIGNVPGVVLGAIILTILPEALRDISTYRYLIYGILLIFMMIIRPQGLISFNLSKKIGGDDNVCSRNKISNKLIRGINSNK